MSPALLNNPGPLMLGGKPASTAVNDVIPLASDLVDHLSRANPTLTSLQTEAVRRELIAVIVQGLQVGIQLLDHRKLPTDQELDGIHTMTVQQALKGVPLSAILNLTNEGISTFRTLILSRADAEDSANLGDLNEFLFALAQRLHSFISISYLSALPAGSQLGEYSAGALVKAMLDGDDPTQLALQMGVELAPRYLVLRLLVNLPPIRPGARNGNHQRIQAYRDLSVAQSKIAAHFGSALLEAPAPQRGLVLIEGTPDWGTVCEVIQRA
ncbi:PucR family transcriptional regulator, partial [Rhodococcus enclensis]|nr:PucR family transcriptional regulator [Rhodococcus qingshengii]